MSIGNRIKELRRLKRISRTDLSRLSGVSLSYLNEIERDLKSPTVITIQKICEALGVSLSEFFAVNGEVIESLPDDLKAFILDQQNHGLIRAMQGIKNKGVSNDMIAAWLGSLSDTITDMRQKIADGQNALLDFAAETKEKYSSEELESLATKYQEKLKDPKSIPPWRKKQD